MSQMPDLPRGPLKPEIFGSVISDMTELDHAQFIIKLSDGSQYIARMVVGNDEAAFIYTDDDDTQQTVSADDVISINWPPFGTDNRG